MCWQFEPEVHPGTSADAAGLREAQTGREWQEQQAAGANVRESVNYGGWHDYRASSGWKSLVTVIIAKLTGEWIYFCTFCIIIELD